MEALTVPTVTLNKHGLLERYNMDNDLLEAGVDEVARGCLFGPVYAAAVILNPNEPLHKWLNDSKKVTKKRRAIVREWVEETALSWAVASVSNVDIDRMNIRNASMEAMNLAIAKLNVKPQLLLVDGNYFTSTHTINDDIPYVTVIEGDAKYGSIAAAAILAKEHHDEYIRKLVEMNPELHTRYDIGSNVGYYGRTKHRDGLQTYGCTEYHRRTFLKRILPSAMPPQVLDDILKESDEDDD